MSMKSFIIKIITFLALVVLFDYIFGITMSYVVNHINVGGQGRDNHICNKAIEDILVFGSSRAVHHYNSSMMEESLGMSCYNCGEDGNGIVLSYGRLLMAKERHQPQIIIHDVTADFDLFKNDNHKYLGWLKARYDRPGISDIFELIDKTERYKMLSQMYRYNSKFLRNLFVFFSSISSDQGVKGYRPLNSVFDSMQVKRVVKPEIYEFDSEKIKFIHKFIDLAEGSKLYFVVSPVWYGMNTEKIAPIRNLCQKQGIPFLDFSNDPKYVHNSELFQNGTHLNSKGADEFTRDLIQVIKQHGVDKCN